MASAPSAAASPPAARARKLRDCTLIAVLALASLFLVARVGLEPRDPTQGVGVVFAPWTVEHDTFVRSVKAGARFVRFGELPFIAVVMPEADGYAARVRSAGAWLVVDPRVLAACFAALLRGETR